jgi:hypothetical protein
MSDFSHRLKRYFRRAGAGSFLISIIVHVFLIGGATVYVVSSVREQRKANFQGGSTASPGPRQDVQHKVQMAKQQQNLSSVTQRLAVDSPNASVSLPDLPDMPGFSGGGPSAGNLGGSGGGSGSGVGSARAPLMPLFGFHEAQPGGTLVGHLYDLKQTPAHKPTRDLAKLGPQKLAIQEVTEFIKKGWGSASLSSFFRAPAPLYATQIFVPVMSADEAPKAYGVESIVKPMAWLAHYKGKVSPPTSGVYRFVGAGDDLMAVRLDGRLVLDCGGSKGSDFTSDHPKPPAYAYDFGKNKWLLDTRGGFTVGKRMELRADTFYDIDIVFSEGPGGLFCAMLLFEQEGATYEKDRKGNPILPIFRVADMKTEKSDTAPRFMENGPVWRALPAPRD